VFGPIKLMRGWRMGTGTGMGGGLVLAYAGDWLYSSGEIECSEFEYTYITFEDCSCQIYYSLK
jgi:hypothetical protein